MEYKIAHRWTGAVLYTVESDSLRKALEGLVLQRANLGGADLGDADLGGADLGDADLRGAELRGAELRGADLGGANLRGANLGDADLRGAELRGANLRGADLRGADLRGADLRGADLRGAENFRLPTGELLTEYTEHVVPALLTAGGKPLAAVVAASWDCHTWGAPGDPLCCPIAEAFSCHDLSGVPLLFRPRAEQFIQLFDAHLLPRPVTEPA